MISNISTAFLLIHLFISFLYMPGSYPTSIAPNEYLRLLQAPIAVDDEYETNQNMELFVAAPWVMLNDEFEDEYIESVLVEPTSHGVASLNTDGSFVYIPDEDFIGEDTFLYQLQGGENSNFGVVQITVRDTQPPHVEWVSPVTQDEILFVGIETVHLEALATDNDFVAGVQFKRWDPYLGLDGDYVYYDFLESPPYEWELYTGDLNPGWNEIVVQAFDASGNVSHSSILLYFIPHYDLYLPILFHDSETLEP
jgi:hypothetical protein